MRQGLNMTVNRLPARTWNGLGMNESRLTGIQIDGKHPAAATLPEGGPIWLAREKLGPETGKNISWEQIETGMGADIGSLACMEENGADVLAAAPGSRCGEVPVLDYSYEPGEKSFNRLHLYAGRGSILDAIIILGTAVPVPMPFAPAASLPMAPAPAVSVPMALAPAASMPIAPAPAASVPMAPAPPASMPPASVPTAVVTAAEGLSALQIKLYAEKGAKIRLYLIQLLAQDTVCLSDIGGVCEEDASLELLKLELGAGRLYAGGLLELEGAGSSFKAQIGYTGKKGQYLDMNYTARHRGKKTESRMDVTGVLEAQSFKLFRGTIDFRPGCSGSKGEEREDTLLLGEDLINQTIPLILCGEEDVEGNHGATIGKLDDRVLFYLGTRGIAGEEAERMIARARMDALCARIPSEAVRARVQRFMEGGTSGGEL